jgi:hypothetical protein
MVCFRLKTRIKREFVRLVCMIGTVTLLKFGPFPSKFPKGTGITKDLNFYGLRVVSRSSRRWMEMVPGVRESNTTVSKIRCLFTKRRGKCKVSLSRSERIQQQK